MATNQSKDQVEVLFKKLRDSANYRDFLKNYLEGRGLSLSDFARATKFGRGFPGDILAGKRRLTVKSFYPFEKALKLPLPGKKMFRCLVALEEPDIFPELTTSEVEKTLTSLRAKAWYRARGHVEEKSHQGFQNLMADPDIISVYAAAGDPEMGATFEQICLRTRLPQLDLSKHLQKLLDMKLMSCKDGIYYPNDLHLFLQTSDRSQILSMLFKNAAEAAQRRVPQGLSSDSEFFFTSKICVREGNLPALKAALRETVLKFVDDSVESDGDRIVNMVTAMHL